MLRIKLAYNSNPGQHLRRTKAPLYQDQHILMRTFGDDMLG